MDVVMAFRVSLIAPLAPCVRRGGVGMSCGFLGSGLVVLGGFWMCLRGGGLGRRMRVVLLCLGRGVRISCGRCLALCDCLLFRRLF